MLCYVGINIKEVAEKINVFSVGQDRVNIFAFISPTLSQIPKTKMHYNPGKTHKLQCLFPIVASACHVKYADFEQQSDVICNYTGWLHGERVLSAFYTPGMAG